MGGGLLGGRGGNAGGKPGLGGTDGGGTEGLGGGGDTGGEGGGVIGGSRGGSEGGGPGGGLGLGSDSQMAQMLHSHRPRFAQATAASAASGPPPKRSNTCTSTSATGATGGAAGGGGTVNSHSTLSARSPAPAAEWVMLPVQVSTEALKAIIAAATLLVASRRRRRAPPLCLARIASISPSSTRPTRTIRPDVLSFVSSTKRVALWLDALRFCGPLKSSSTVCSVVMRASLP